ncbi:hypothetical protein [Commensalibacter nepenthis]|uniref:Entry exclusion protein 1 n=1 Tax=Commensalibacter nepenthis TaxID=3043872 RepID=A0ABT6QAM7_9PROT|nr:hypothetical protein [Commensalibacter sp. TBRC 10068]MDI2113965.1 hypothetical protein [Commensalibacter sp. TBRC 10068]
MPIVSISEAARLTGKSRRTLHRHIDAGRVSRSHTPSGEQGIEISELIRVYGELKTQPVTSGQNEPRLQRATGDDTERPPTAQHDIKQNDTETRRIHDLEKEVESLNRLLSSKQETIDSLKTALKLLEHRQDKSGTIEPPKENNVSEPQKNGTSVDDNGNTGLLGRFKKLFS